MSERINKQRRRLSQWLGAAAVSPLFFPWIEGAFAASSDKKLSIVIAGCGLAGLAAAHRLKRQLPNAKITMVDAKKTHHYQPGYTLLATGVWHDVKQVSAKNADLMPSGVSWVEEELAEINAERNQITTNQNKKIDYDFLIIATGLRLAYEDIVGLDVQAFGEKGLGSVYHSPEVALKTWQAMQGFCQTGGRAVMTLAPTDIKCAGAPLKMTFMLADRLRLADMSKEAVIDFYSAKNSIFSVKTVQDNVLQRWEKLATVPTVYYEHVLHAVDMDKKQAFFRRKDGTIQKEYYDFIHVVPPMFATDAVFHNADLANGKGWLDVNKQSLQHNRYPNIFGLGDVNGTPRGKTAATVKKSAPIAVNNLIRCVNDQEVEEVFDGYTSCPMLLRVGSAMLVEFNGDGELTPTLPFVDPLQESYFAWYLEEVMLKPAYMTVLKGRA